MLHYDVSVVIAKFRKSDLSAYPDVTKYERALEAGLWVLWVYYDKVQQDGYLNSDEISDILDSRGVSFNTIEIARAFARAKKKIGKKRSGKYVSYKIMQKGIDYLRELQSSGNVQVFMFEGNRQHTSRQKITDVVTQSKGALLVVDKFYSRQTLNMLRQFEHGVEIRMLTAELAGGESESKFLAEMASFKQEYRNIKIRKYPKAYELHDRYLITDNSLILLGHGLIDIGSKESLVIVLKNENAKEIKDSLRAKFEERWLRSANL
jgi:hypothetical protein